MRLTREHLLAAAPPTEDVTIPELGGVVRIRGLSAGQRDAFEDSCFVGRGKDRRENLANLRARLVALCAVDEAGQPLFSAEDVATLANARADVVDRLFAVAQRLSGIGKTDLEELAGNSASAPVASTSSPSPNGSGA